MSNVCLVQGNNSSAAFLGGLSNMLAFALQSRQYRMAQAGTKADEQEMNEWSLD